MPDEQFRRAPAVACSRPVGAVAADRGGRVASTRIYVKALGTGTDAPPDRVDIIVGTAENTGPSTGKDPRHDAPRPITSTACWPSWPR